MRPETLNGNRWSRLGGDPGNSLPVMTLRLRESETNSRQGTRERCLRKCKDRNTTRLQEPAVSVLPVDWEAEVKPHKRGSPHNSLLPLTSIYIVSETSGDGTGVLISVPDLPEKI